MTAHLVRANVVITLVQERDGWRFDSWRETNVRRDAHSPGASDRNRRFAFAADGADYFRSIWPK